MAVKNANNSGSNRNPSNSASSLVSTLIPALLIACVFVVLFLIFRRKLHRLYAPRSYVGSLEDRQKTPQAQTSLFGWIKDYRNTPDEIVLNADSLDGYLFLRFTKVVVVICFVGCCITWPVLFPVNITGGGGKKQLDKLSFSNVDVKTHATRYYAHALVAVVFLSAIMVVIARECFYLINLRKAYLLSAWNASRISSRTILFTSVPNADLNEEAIRARYPGARQVWIPTDCKELTKLVEERDDTAMKLEGGEIRLSKDANANRLKAEKGKKHYESNEEGGFPYLNPKDRPTHKLKFLIGKKVDTIEYGRTHLTELIPKVQAGQDSHWNGKEKHVTAAFVEFNTLTDAQAAWGASQNKLNKVKGGSPIGRQMGVLPGEVIWKNLGMKSAMVTIRHALATAFIVIMIIFWAIPVAVVGIISNINNITDKVHFLSFINDIPSVILGVVTGLLPVVLLAVLMSLVPVVCRFAAKLGGAMTLSQVELQCQSWYFAFQVIQVFLITTFSSAATSVVTKIIKDPGTAPSLLATNLPLASNFYISYFILLGLSFSSKALFNAGGFVMTHVLGRFFMKNPRKMYTKYITLAGPALGSTYPVWTNVGVIAITYSCIAPLVMGFAFVGLALVYLAFRYNFLYVFSTNIDTKGATYAKALHQLSTGVYLSAICLIGLFAISIASNRAAIGPLVIMLVFLIVCIAFHVFLKMSLRPFLNSYAETDDGMPTATPARAEESTAEGESPNEKGSEVQMAPQASSGGYSKPGILYRLLAPKKKSVEACRAMLHEELNRPLPPLSAEVEKKAFWNPAVTSETPILWIVKDEMGISAREVKDTIKVLPITDEGAQFDEKNRVVWDIEKVRDVPIWVDHPVY
ncbi:DUF221-domain-containing protein [Mytilinidion resinicola]|uniref:DUF221-domain-containing protein n=1 Tax=Mytilinidion resinicola TaxID=574789 RepID=A0A6A6YF48_9PEZI|nr:DUF221-domain-containing protein [Mytilinidion resinicola]KAF2806685.1 DUF221-domain-containing protein [Mytilinidion resinicola]